MNFIKHKNNPILTPNKKSMFLDPIKGNLFWEEKDVFNPGAVVFEEKVALCYRAEDKIGKYAGTSRIGLAVSYDGINFDRMPFPVLYPENDKFFEDEKEGGCEDPRVVEAPDGSFVMTYTAYNGVLPRLFVATSRDLNNWTKHGYVFSRAAEVGRFDRDFRCKSGAILCEVRNGRLIAVRHRGCFWMFWGEGVIYAAKSDNLIDWVPVFNSEEFLCKAKKSSLNHIKWNGDDRLYAVLDGRRGLYDSWLVEPGPPPVLTDDGIVIIYNGAVKNLLSKPRGMQYSVGYAVLNKDNPLEVIKRPKTPFLVPEEDFEISGQINKVCFAEGLVLFKDKWYLYYGTADSKIAVAVSKDLFVCY